jgi:hypothetical protein
MGDMGEAGAAAGQFHDEIGGYAKSHGIDRLLCLGELSEAAAPTSAPAASTFARSRTWSRVAARRTRAADHGAGQGFALHAHGARRRGAPDEGDTECCLNSPNGSPRTFRAFNVFGYITLRAVLATMTALAISFVFGPAVIRWLTEKKIGQSVRSDGPQTHLIKAGTPTMGGALILISLGVSTLLWADLSNRFVWIVLIVTLGFGAVGWVDDWRKVVYRNPDGLSARAKFFWQSVIGLVAAIYLAFSISAPNNEKVVHCSSSGSRQRLHAWNCRSRPTSSCPSSRPCPIRWACSASWC